MISMAQCEGAYQYNPDGTVHRGVVNPHDVGLFQINETYHLKEAQAMGLNIYTTDGNAEFAMYLFSKNHFKDWTASAACQAKLSAGADG